MDQGASSLIKNPNQLRDLISQQISASLQTHNIRNKQDLQDSLKEDDNFDRTTRSMKEEEAKNRVEQ